MDAQLSRAADSRPADLVTTRAQLPRPSRRPNYRAEVTGTSGLSAMIMTDPAAAIPKILASAAALCRAGSAGMSLLIRTQADVVIIRWAHVSGQLHGAAGFESPRAENPCGLCLDSGGTVVVRQPERAFPQLKAIHPAIVEQLIVPLRDHAYRSFGTLWVAAHEIGTRLSFEDARILEHLAAQLTLALQLLEQTREHLLVLKQCQRLTRELVEEQLLRHQVQAANFEFGRKLTAARMAVVENNHRVKNSLTIAMSLLSMHGRATSDPSVREELQASRSRLAALSRVHDMLADTANAAQEVQMQRLLDLIVYALHDLFAVSHDGVQLHITSEPIILSADDAVSIALFINEAVTNAYKHAFPTETAGTIAVHMSRTADQGLLLRIMDNGVGMPGIRPHEGMGMTLMQSLADQLNGELTFTPPTDVTGTVVTLRLYRTPEDSITTQSRATSV